MSTTTKRAHRRTIALALPKIVALLIVFAENIVKRIAANPYFPTPTYIGSSWCRATASSRDEY
jgi:hypothetical protein